MEGILYRIDSMQNKFTEVELNIAEFIIKNPHLVKNLSLKELSANAHVSMSAITRFAKVLGYKGYRDFKIDFTYQLAVSNKGIFIDYNKDEFDENVTLNLLNQYKIALSETHRLCDEKVMKKVAKMLYKSKVVVCTGVGASGLVARDLVMKLLRVEKIACYANDIDNSKLLINQLGENDILFAISYSGEKKEILELAKFAKQKGKKIVSLTRFGDTTLGSMSDEVLKVVAYENKFRSSAVTSRITQMYIIDIIYFMMLQEFENKGKNILQYTYNLAHEGEGL